MMKPQRAVDHPLPFVCVAFDLDSVRDDALTVVSLSLNPKMTIAALGTFLAVGHFLTADEFEAKIEKADKEFKFTKEQSQLLKEKNNLFIFVPSTSVYNTIIDDERRMADVLVLN